MEKNKEKTLRSWAEAVSPGHPDKTADIISEYLLDRYIEKDPDTRYAVEVMIKGNRVILGGEVTSKHHFEDIEIAKFVYEAIELIGYTSDYAEAWKVGDTYNCINPDIMSVYINISEQSPEIGQGVNNNGWGDQGIFYGYADPDGDEYMMPLAHSYAMSLCNMLYINAKEKGIGGLDIKTEVLMTGKRIDRIYAAVPCRTAAECEKVLESINNWLEEKKQTRKLFSPSVILNGTGNYVMHSAIADCGITGRKLAVDFYSGQSPIGGGSPWTKDASKADLSLNLYARYLAKQKAKELGKAVSVHIACCIGQSTVSYQVVEPCGEVIENNVKNIDYKELKTLFGLDKPIFTSSCFFGLFGEFQKDKKWEN